MSIKWSGLLAIFLSLAVSVNAGWVIQKGKFVNVDELATMSVEEHYAAGTDAIDRFDWKEVVKQFTIVYVNFPNTPYGQEAPFFVGAAYFQLGEFDFANDALSRYLKCHTNPQYFEEAIRYKFEIANRFRCGAKKRCFGTKQLPKWIPAKDLALEIYDEVIAAVPCHELAVWSLYDKADLLWKNREYRDSVEVYQQLIKRFPKHELAPESYLAISRVYLEQSQIEVQNPDILALAQLNLRRFERDFPRDERLCYGEENFQVLKELSARALYDIAGLYERKKYPCAAILYYQRAILQFPDTHVAGLCQSRLTRLGCDWVPPEPEQAEEQNPVLTLPPELQG